MTSVGFAAICWPFHRNGLSPDWQKSWNLACTLFLFQPVSTHSPAVICKPVRWFESGLSLLTHSRTCNCLLCQKPWHAEVRSLLSMGGRHWPTDSNKASSWDLSPYDNNSPVLSERSLLAMQEDVVLRGSEKLYKGPEVCVRRVGHLPSSKSRESSPGPRLGKGNSSSPSDCMWPGVSADLVSNPPCFMFL